MGSKSLSLKTHNKLRRKQLYVEQKRVENKSRHEERHRRRKEEAKDPELRKERLERNKTKTIDNKRVWDDVDDDSLGAIVDVAQLKRRRLEQAEAAAAQEADESMGGLDEEKDEEDDDVDSMLDSDEENESGEEDAEERTEKMRAQRAQRNPSIAPSTASTNLDLTPDSLTTQFPNLFSDEPLEFPKVLFTTSLNATIHKEAQDIAAIFPNSEYIKRSAHAYGHKYSVREIAKFAKNRGYTALIIIGEDQKKPCSMSVVHLNGEDVAPGPTLTYTIRNYLPGKKLLGHGNPTNHYVSSRPPQHTHFARGM